MAAVILSTCALAACVESRRVEGCGPDVRSASAPLLGGSPQAQGLTELQQSAVVALAQRTADGQRIFCSGVLIAPGLVLSARHCFGPSAPTLHVVLGPSLDQNVLELEIASVEIAAEHDLALVALAYNVPAEVARPLALRYEPPAVGTRATLAGYGQAEHGLVGTRLFVEEPVTELMREVIVVDGDGETGGCVGDSGGPLLVRGADAGYAVSGVLSIGSASCLAADHYQRLDPAEEALRIAIERSGAGPWQCPDAER